MPTRDEVLRDKTYREEGFDTQRRVFYTLTRPLDDRLAMTEKHRQQDADLTAYRTARLVSEIVAHLERKGLLTGTDLDDVLLAAAHA